VSATSKSHGWYAGRSIPSPKTVRVGLSLDCQNNASLHETVQSDLACLRAPAPAPKAFQALHGHVLRGKGPGYRGLYLSPPKNAAVLCVDEKSQIQVFERTHPMLPWVWDASRESPTILRADDHPVCCTGHCQGMCSHMQAETPAPGISSVPQARRAECSSRARCPTSSSTTTPPQASAGQTVACLTRAVACPLHANLCLMAQPGRNQVELIAQNAIRPWNVLQCQRTDRENPEYVDNYNRHPKTLRLDGNCRLNLPQNQTICSTISETAH